MKTSQKYQQALLAMAITWVTVINVMSQTPSRDWQHEVHGAWQNTALDVAATDGGNIIVVGTFQGVNLDFGGTTLTSENESNIFIAKYDANANLIWIKDIGSHEADNHNDIARAVDLDAEGNIYVTGSFSGTDVDFDPEHPENPNRLLSAPEDFWGFPGQNVFIVKYNADGQFIWGKSIGDDMEHFGEDLYVQGDYIYTTGEIGGFSGAEIDFDPGSDHPDRFLPPASLSAVYIAKYHKDGTLMWVNGATHAIRIRGKEITADADGNVYTCGHFVGQNTDFNRGAGDPQFIINSIGPGDLAAPSNLFICKHNQDGEIQWVKGIGNIGWEEALGLVTDETGALYVTGYFEGSGVDFDPANDIENDTRNGQGKDIFLAKYTAQGTLQWVNQMGGNTALTETGFELNYHEDTGLWMVGQFAGTNVDFGGITITSRTQTTIDAFLANYNTDGTLRKITPWGSGGDFSARGIALSSPDQLYVTGTFHNPGSTVKDNLFIAKFYDPEYEPTIQVQGNGIDIATQDTTPSLDDGTDFGNVSIGESVTHSFTIYNKNTEPLIIHEIQLDVAAFNTNTTLPFTMPASSEATFNITYTPIHTTTERTTVTIESNDATMPGFTFDLQGKGTPVVTAIDPAQETTITMFPCPTHGTLYITGLPASKHPVSLVIYSLQGTQMAQTKLYPDGQKKQINLQFLPKGTYILTLQSTEQEFPPERIILH